EFQARSLCLQPSRFVVLCFKFVECGLMAQRQSDVVKTFDETELTKWINLECGVETLVVSHRLSLKRDGQAVVGNRLRVVEQLRYLIFTEADKHDTVLAGVGKKDVGKSG